MSARPSGARPAILVGAAVCLLVAGFVLGRAFPDAADRRASYLEQLTDDLDLRPDQVAAVERVLAEEDREIDDLLGSLQGDVAARRVRTEQQVLAVLDGAQRQRYDSLMAAGEQR